MSAAHTVPNLTKLPFRQPKELDRGATNGFYCLEPTNDANACESSVVLVRGALPMDERVTKEIDDAFRKVEDATI